MARLPLATYRLPLNDGFTLGDARDLVPYLRDLGISDLYASPIFAARPGSTHGYDVVDPTRVGESLGGRAGLEALAAELRSEGLGLVLDIVPNHMAAHPANRWWWDVLENGRGSPYALYFDIDWTSSDGGPARLVLPVLGAPAPELVARGELALAIEDGALLVRYHEARFPLDPATWGAVLGDRGAANPAPDDVGPALGAIAVRADATPRACDAGASGTDAGAREGARRVKAALRDLLAREPAARERVARLIDAFARGAEGRGRMVTLLEAQPYRLAYWKEGVRQVNYRRFFDISELVGVRVEDPEVFRATHALILELVREGRATGLRIDHIDGLHDPLGYLQRLAGAIPDGGDQAGPGVYLVVEKILAAGEGLPDEWPCHGTTGYEFIAALNELLVDAAGFERLREHAARSLGLPPSFEDEVRRSKRHVLETLFHAEVAALAAAAAALAQRDPDAPGIAAEAWRAAVRELTVHLPVYRTYIRSPEVAPRDRALIDRATTDAQRSLAEAGATGAGDQGHGPASPPGTGRAIAALRHLLLVAGRDVDGALRLAMRWQQLSGPAAAKGVEDTALYRYTPLVALNEVGGEPTIRGGVQRFHALALERAARRSGSLSASSTHDTKRGEDVRARLAVLSEIPGEWTAFLDRWRARHAPRRATLPGGAGAPSPTHEVLLYQTLIGAWPLHGDQPDAAFTDRIQSYMTKAIREAKQHTSWTDPSEPYERAIRDFVAAILDPQRSAGFLADLAALERTISYHGMLNGLAQTTLKLAAPGVPDFYRGAELWDLSLVDPDNRRPVDFALRRGLLNRLRADAALADLLASWPDGRVKLHVIHRGLALRRTMPAPFRGDYAVLDASGERAGHLVVFARRAGGEWVIAAVPRLTVALGRGRPPLGRWAWADTTLHLPPDAPRHWTDVFTGASVVADASSATLAAAEIFRAFPVALLAAAATGPFAGSAAHPYSGPDLESPQPTPWSEHPNQPAACCSPPSPWRCWPRWPSPPAVVPPPA